MKNKYRSKKVKDCKFGMNCKELEYGRCHKNHYSEYSESHDQSSKNLNQSEIKTSDPLKKKRDILPSKDDLGNPNGVENILTNHKFLTLDIAFEDLSSKPKLSINEKPLIEYVLQQLQSKSFEIINFYNLTNLLDQILKSEKADQTEFILLADSSGLFYGEILQQFKDRCDHQRIWDSKEETIKAAKAIHSIIAFYECMMNMIPSCSAKLQIEVMVKWAINLSTESANKLYLFCLSPQETEQKSLLVQLKPKVEYLQKIKEVNDSKYMLANPDIKEQGIFKSHLANSELAEIKPKDNFRNICLYPIPSDFEDHVVKLRKNKINEPFKNLNQYLDIQFRLLREDFYVSIREGFLEFDNANNRRRNKNLVFSKGQVSYLVVTQKTIGINIVVNLPNSRKFSTNKRFIFGSMVILSSTNFYDYVVCIVKNFDSKEAEKTLKKGLVNVQVEVVKAPGSLGLEDIEFSEIHFDIVETKVYFEPYYQVLFGLQKIYSLPLAELIVKCQFNKNTCPLYLSQSVTNYNHQLQPKMNLKKEINSIVEQWVNTTKFTFDEAQASALRHIFKTQVSLIQGPPGTGKTNVGVHLVRILLELKKRFLFEGPIFIICCTNHALDQFLENLTEFTQKIARLGGQTKNDALKEYTLAIKKEKAAARRRVKKPAEYYTLLDKKSIYLDDINEMKKKYQSKFTYRFITNQEIFTEKEAWYFDQVLLDYRREYQSVINYIAKGDKPASKKFKTYFNMRFPSVPEFGLAILHWLELLDFDRLIFQWDQYSANKKDDEEEEAYEDKLNDYLAQRALEQNNEHNQYNEDDEDIKNQVTSIDNIMFMNSEAIEVPDRTIKTNSDLFYYYESILSTRYNESQTIYNKIYKNIDMKQESQKRSVTVSKSEKWILNHYFMDFRFNLLEDISKTVLELKNINEQLDAYDDEYSRNLIKDDDIIAMTTTGAAKYKNILRGIDSKIIIVEEAAEVIESHITVSLTPSTEHLVLIGDHMQLRPSTNDYFLSKHYNLDISMFERLINNGISNIRILDQRRMRPEISGLIKLLYPDLVDAKTVLGRPNIKGFPYNLFFFNHRWLELEEEDKDSKVNNKEGDFICKFVELLVKNGYGQNQITILSLYSGQLLYIKKETMKNSLIKNIRITTVDNFQGEENDIIVLSLVRSNSQKKIGFLKVSNRVNVALSRAKLGLFIFGNAECIRDAELNFYKNDVSQSFWLNIFSYLDKNGYIDDHLKFVCIRHQISIVIKSVDDFKNCPNGGCQKVCEARLECGHSCPKICHEFSITINNRDGHADFQCMKICQRPHYCGHRCDNKCHTCDLNNWKCKKIIDYSHPVCKHLFKIACHRSSDSPSKITCLEKCGRLLNCGHLCEKLCYETCNKLTSSQKMAGYYRSCDKVVEYTRQCGHKENKLCGQKPEMNECQEMCKRPHNCEHPCNNRCRDCSIEKWKCNKLIDFIHPLCKHNLKIECYKSFLNPHKILCTNNCSRLLPCSHKCQKICYESCDKLTFEQQNGHYLSSCNEIVEYTRKCGHQEKKTCGQKAEINECQQMCERPHKCGHPCNNKCRDCGLEIWTCCKIIDFVHPICKHELKIQCYQSYENPVTIKCSEKCSRLLSCDHECQKSCFEECNVLTLSQQRLGYLRSCDKIVEYTRQCGHQDNKPCGQKPEINKCQQMCKRPHKCKHPCNNKCRDCGLEIWTCCKKIDFVNPICKHEIKIQCYQSYENPITVKCSHPCSRLLSCNHECQKSCFEECNRLTLSQRKANYLRSCDKVVEYTRQCGHQETKPCGQKAEINECQQMCERPHKCEHPCNNKCRDCGPEIWTCCKIIDFVHPICKHELKIQCYQSYENPVTIKCSEKCSRLLSCDHECQKSCFEECNVLTLSQQRLGYLRSCDKIVEYTRQCGHQDNKPCGQKPEINKCQQMCKRPHKCEHPCNNKCIDCDLEKWKCLKTIDFVHPNCGHIIQIPCYRSFEKPQDIKCLKKCSRNYCCGHPCTKICYEDCNFINISPKQSGFFGPCQLIIPYTRNCQHLDNKICGLSPEVNTKLNKCHKICDKILDCLHKCKSDCDSCFSFSKIEKVDLHNKCTEPCNKILICDHKCQSICTEAKYCPPCVRKCSMRCLHSKCFKQCGEECSVCSKPCSWECPHLKCTKKCFEICDRKPCDRNCSKTLICGHPCVGLCGEICPKLCRTCDSTNHIFLNAAENDKLIELECGDSFFCKTLDEYFTSKFNPKGLKYVACPKCNQQITFCMRYQDKIKKIAANISLIKNAIIVGSMLLHSEIQTNLIAFLNFFINNPIDLFHTNYIETWLNVINISKSNVYELNKLYFGIKYFQKYLQLMSLAPNIINQTNYSNISSLFRILSLECDNSVLVKLKLSRIIETLIEYVKLNIIHQYFSKTFIRYMAGVHKELDYQQIINTCQNYIQKIEKKNGFISKNLYQEIRAFNTSFNDVSETNFHKTLALDDVIQVFSLGSFMWDFCPHGFPYQLHESIAYMKLLKCEDCQKFLAKNLPTNFSKTESFWFTEIKKKSDSLALNGIVDFKPAKQNEQNCYK